MKYFRWLISTLFFTIICDSTTIAEENGTRSNKDSLLYDGNERNEKFIDNSSPILHPYFMKPCPKNNCSDYSIDNHETITNRLTERSCHCDEKCIDYQDCCVDSRYYDEAQRKPNQYECRNYGFAWYLTKSVCPTTWTNEKIREKCSMSEDYSNLNVKEVELRIPVTSLKTNITYGNIYCALCNKESFVKLWRITMEYDCGPGYSDAKMCSNLEKSTVNAIQFRNNQWAFVYNDTVQYIDSIQLRPPENTTIEYCQGHSIISSCPSTWTDIDMEEKCRGVYLRVTNINDQQVYKNEYCAYCNGANESDLNCNVCEDCGKHTILFAPPNSFTVLFDYKFETKLLPLCHQDQTSLNEQTCLLEANTTQTSSANDNWFFTAYTPIAISLSLLFLVIHLIIFSYVQELHSIGGKCIASYCVALTLAYGTFLFAYFVDGVICTAVAILIYYFFISAFTWMLTISYDLWKTFWNVTKHLRSPSNSKKTFILYSSWSWSVPLIPALVVMYLHVSSSDSNLAPHFGEGSCWFKNGYSLLIFFVCPVCLVIIVNFALFLHTSIMVRSSQCKSVNQKSQVDFRLFARIALLTGITWITGFFGGYTQEPVIWFIFIVLNTAQGILIFIAFSCKKKIIYSFLKRVGKCKNWQIALQDSNKSTDTKSIPMTTTLSKNT